MLDPSTRAATSDVHYRKVNVQGIEIFYRDAGSSESPTMLLLHGFPTSSHMFRDLIVWGRNDFVFLPAGARAYRKDLKHVELHLLNAGHFALETNAAEIAHYIREFRASRE